MTDDPKKRGRQDRSKISTREEWELRYWSKKFGVTRRALVQAVKAVGHGVKKVGAFLRD